VHPDPLNSDKNEFLGYTPLWLVSPPTSVVRYISLKGASAPKEDCKGKLSKPAPQPSFLIPPRPSLESAPSIRIWSKEDAWCFWPHAPLDGVNVSATPSSTDVPRDFLINFPPLPTLPRKPLTPCRTCYRLVPFPPSFWLPSTRGLESFCLDNKLPPTVSNFFPFPLLAFRIFVALALNP